MVGEISESVAAFFDLDDDLYRFFGAFEDRGVLVERLECGVLEEAVPAAAVVGWMAVAPSLLFGVISTFSPSL